MNEPKHDAWILEASGNYVRTPHSQVRLVVGPNAPGTRFSSWCWAVEIGSRNRRNWAEVDSGGRSINLPRGRAQVAADVFARAFAKGLLAALVGERYYRCDGCAHRSLVEEDYSGAIRVHACKKCGRVYPAGKEPSTDATW